MIEGRGVKKHKIGGCVDLYPRMSVSQSLHAYVMFASERFIIVWLLTCSSAWRILAFQNHPRMRTQHRSSPSSRQIIPRYINTTLLALVGIASTYTMSGNVLITFLQASSLIDPTSLSLRQGRCASVSIINIDIATHPVNFHLFHCEKHLLRATKSINMSQNVSQGSLFHRNIRRVNSHSIWDHHFDPDT